MPIVAVAVRGLLAGLVADALRVIIPLVVGLSALTLAMGQGIAAEAMRTPSTRAEFFRPLLVTVSLRSSGLPVEGEDGQLVVAGAVPAHLLLAIAEVWSGFDPTQGCGAAGDGRRGLLAVRPSEYAARTDSLRRALGREPLPVGRGVCEPEHNAIVATSRLGRFYLARVSEIIFENRAYRAALEEFDRQERAYRRCQAEQDAIIADPTHPRHGDPPSCDAPDASLLVPPPACIERHGDPNPRSPQQPDHVADWEDKETICRVVDRYAGGLSFPLVWAARERWKAELADPIRRVPRAPSWTEPAEAPGGSAGYAVGEAVRYARAQLGKPYVWGGADPAIGFDCSGLVQWAYGQAGLRLPRTAEEQFRATERVAYDHLRPGDLVFFCCDPGQPHTRVSHVGIYLGAGRMLDAPAPGKPVRIEPVWLDDYIGGGRVRLPAS
jgi:cell wall-associated NlpC family hydrolase